jgi:hypothetical protein
MLLDGVYVQYCLQHWSQGENNVYSIVYSEIIEFITIQQPLSYVCTRVARYFLYLRFQNGKNITNDHNYTKRS